MKLSLYQTELLEELMDLENEAKTNPDFDGLQFKRYEYLIAYLSDFLPLKSYHQPYISNESSKYLPIKRTINVRFYINIGEAIYTYQLINGERKLMFYGLFQVIAEDGNVYFCNGEKSLPQSDCYILNSSYIK